jgi:methyltransferase (TIGR00027 family)
MRGVPSVTAWAVAQRRAMHQVLDRPLVFEDPVALHIVAGQWRNPKATEPAEFSSSFRAFMAARSRYAEDSLASAYERGVRQYVLLGAGLDTFAYRNPRPDLRVFEVDHPATQAWKRELLAANRIHEPIGLTFVPVDFETQSLADRLRESGFSQAPTFFSWLGVAPYLTREAFDSTVAFVASMPAPSGVAFDYTIPPELMSPKQRTLFEGLALKVARAGEPFRLFLHPQRLQEDLRAAGFTTIEDLTCPDLDTRYFAGRTDGLTPKAGTARLVSAST